MLLGLGFGGAEDWDGVGGRKGICLCERLGFGEEGVCILAVLLCGFVGDEERI